MSRWLFDLGNTRLKFARLQANGTPGEVVAIAHRSEDIVADLERLLPADGEVAYLASVASSDSTARLRDVLARRFASTRTARTSARFADVRIAYEDADKLGVDRFLALLAARARDARPWLVVGVGTALTIDLLDASGRHIGGRIAPSPELMRAALHRRASQLPETGGAYVEFAGDTVSALASGCEGAAIALIGQSLHAATQTIRAEPSLLLHGGGAPALLPRLPQGELASHLVLEGLANWAQTPSE